MIYKETTTSVRQHLGELLNKVQYRRDSILITKAGRPVAALIDITLFEKIRLMKAEFERLSAKFAQTYQQATSEIATRATLRVKSISECSPGDRREPGD